MFLLELLHVDDGELAALEAEGYCQVVVVKLLHEADLILRSRRNRFAVHSVDYHALHVEFFRLFAFDDVDNDVVGEFVVACAVFFDEFYFLFKFGRVGFVAERFDYLAACVDSKFRKKASEQMDVTVVDTIEVDGIYVVNVDNTFNHLFRLFCCEMC